MGFVDKIKDLFTEEIDEPATPVKKEMTKVEIPAPTPEEVTIEREQTEEIDIPKEYQEPREYHETPKREEVRQQPVKEKNPIFFDDDDFKELEPKKEEKPKVREEPKPQKNGLYGVLKEEEHKFKPSKIISPVYGVLGENYDKDDITAKKTQKVQPKSTYVAKSKTPTLDEVRNRAFGTLEDELEDTLTKIGPTIFDKDTSYGDVKQPKHMKDDDEINPDMTLEELDELARQREEETKLEGNELFDLIDQMRDE